MHLISTAILQYRYLQVKMQKHLDSAVDTGCPRKYP